MLVRLLRQVLPFVVLFFLLLRRPPRSTLFPTRRSSDLGAARDRSAGDEANPRDFRVSRGARPAARRSGEHRVKPDRKSTRLNSSHVKISYAVFCLKKKKNKKLSQRTSSSYACVRLTFTY